MDKWKKKKRQKLKKKVIIEKTSWGWAVPSSVKVWGLVEAVSLIFENDNVEEVWSQSSLKLKKLSVKKVWSFRWWSLKLKKD